MVLYLLNMIIRIVFFSFLLFITGCSFSGNVENTNNQSTDTLITDTSESDQHANSKKIIIIFGNSLTAGYGLEVHESFPAILQARIDSLKLPYTIVNAGISGETSATGVNRIDWVLEKQSPDIFILELGANDGLRGLPPEVTKKNLTEIINRVSTHSPNAEIILAGMMVPPSMGQEYSNKYNPIYKEIAQEKDIALIPFLLEGVGGIDSLNQSDRIHPNAAGARIMAQNVWEILGPMIGG